MELAGQLTRELVGGRSQGRMTLKAPVRTEPHPTFSRCLRAASHMTLPPYGIGRPIDKGTRGGQVTRQDDAESRGFGRSLTLPSALPPRGVAYDVTPLWNWPAN
jgi:hypothetical protein